MMISSKGRYALRVMIDLAQKNSDQFIPLKDIAARQCISEKYLEAILPTLIKNNFLIALRGKGGGYKLSRKSEDYTAGSIIRTVENSFSTVSCLESGQVQCERADICHTLPIWQGLDKLINDYLDSFTLADLCKNPSDILKTREE